MRFTYEKYCPEAEMAHIREHAPHQTGRLVFRDAGYLVFDSQNGLLPNSAIAYCRTAFDAESITAALNNVEHGKAGA